MTDKRNKILPNRIPVSIVTGFLGSGKTTLLDLLYSRRNIVKGNIKFEEKDIYSYSNQEYQNQIAVVPQKFSLPWGTVENYILKTIRRYSHIKNPDKSFIDYCKNV